MKRTAEKEKKCITLDDMYELLNEQTKQDLENHSEKEYLTFSGQEIPHLYRW